MRELEYREAIKEAVIEEMDRDPGVFLIGEDIGVYGGAFRAYKGLLDKYGPERVVDACGFCGPCYGPDSKSGCKDKIYDRR